MFGDNLFSSANKMYMLVNVLNILILELHTCRAKV